MPQTSISSSMTTAFAGMPYGSREPETDSYINGESSAEIPFGVMVAQGSADNECRLLATGDTVDDFIGITRHSHAYNKTNELGTTGVKPDCLLGVMVRGEAWVLVEEAVTPGSLPLVRIIASGAEIAGSFRDTADASDCIDVSAFCRFKSTSTGAGVVRLEFDMAGRYADIKD